MTASLQCVLLCCGSARRQACKHSHATPHWWVGVPTAFWWRATNCKQTQSAYRSPPCWGALVWPWLSRVSSSGIGGVWCGELAVLACHARSSAARSLKFGQASIPANWWRELRLPRLSYAYDTSIKQILRSSIMEQRWRPVLSCRGVEALVSCYWSCVV